MRKPTTIALLAMLAASSLATPAHAATTCYGRRATLVGTKRSETLRGTDGRDVIVARGGNDRVFAGKGSDLVCGGPGATSSWERAAAT